MDKGISPNIFPQFRCSYLNAKRYSKFGRPSGGFLIGIKELLYKTWDFDIKFYDQFVIIKCQYKSKESVTCYFVGVYISSIDNYVTDLYPIIEPLSGFPVFYFGNFNAKIGNGNFITENQTFTDTCFVSNYGETTN